MKTTSYKIQPVIGQPGSKPASSCDHVFLIIVFGSVTTADCPLRIISLTLGTLCPGANLMCTSLALKHSNCGAAPTRRCLLGQRNDYHESQAARDAQTMARACSTVTTRMVVERGHLAAVYKRRAGERAPSPREDHCACDRTVADDRALLLCARVLQVADLQAKFTSSCCLHSASKRLR